MSGYGVNQAPTAHAGILCFGRFCLRPSLPWLSVEGSNIRDGVYVLALPALRGECLRRVIRRTCGKSRNRISNAHSLAHLNQRTTPKATSERVCVIATSQLAVRCKRLASQPCGSDRVQNEHRRKRQDDKNDEKYNQNCSGHCPHSRTPSACPTTPFIKSPRCSRSHRAVIRVTVGGSHRL